MEKMNYVAYAACLLAFMLDMGAARYGWAGGQLFFVAANALCIALRAQKEAASD